MSMDWGQWFRGMGVTAAWVFLTWFCVGGLGKIEGLCLRKLNWSPKLAVGFLILSAGAYIAVLSGSLSFGGGK